MTDPTTILLWMTLMFSNAREMVMSITTDTLSIVTATKWIKKHEGFAPELYQCPSGKWSIGYGRNVEDRGISNQEAIEILKRIKLTKEEAENMLSNDILAGYERLNTCTWFVKQNAVRKAILLDMWYNLGSSGLFKFRKMIKALNDENYKLAANEMAMSAWYSQVPNRAKFLIDKMKRGV